MTLAWVVDVSPEDSSEVVFASCEGRAKVLAGRLTGDNPRHVELRREPKFDVHAPGPVPLAATLAAGWWHECAWCYHHVAEEGCERCADGADADVLAEPVVSEDSVWCSESCREAWDDDTRRHREHEAYAALVAREVLPDATVEFVGTESATLLVPGCIHSVTLELETQLLRVQPRDIHVVMALGRREPLAAWESEGGAL